MKGIGLLRQKLLRVSLSYFTYVYTIILLVSVSEFGVTRSPAMSSKQDLDEPKSCALVLNSGSLFGSKLHGWVDDFDWTCRFNMAPTAGFEIDVGSTTDVLILGAHEVRSILKNLPALEKTFSGAKIAIIRPLNQYSEEEISNLITVSQKQGHHLRVFIGSEKPALDALNRYNNSTISRMTSTGFFGIAAMAHLCSNLTIFGDVLDLEAPYYYFNPTGPVYDEIARSPQWKIGNHDLLLEKRIIERAVIERRKKFSDSGDGGQKKFTKCLTVAPAPASLDAKGTAFIFLQYVYRLHGIVSSIVSDRDPKFTSQFWVELMSQLGCQKLQSTAYHPQSDGQTERVNRVLEDMIRCYCDELLWSLEFSYSDSYQQSTKFTPFYLNYGRHPRKPHTIALGLEDTEKTTASSEYLDVLFRCHQTATHNMRVAQHRQTQYANKSRRVAVYKEGDRVLLYTHKLKWEGKQIKKLQPRWIGPFTVVRVIPNNAVELNSKQQGYAFHPVVNVDRLKHYHSRMNIDAMNHQLEREWDDSTAENTEEFSQNDQVHASDDITINSDDFIIPLDDE